MSTTLLKPDFSNQAPSLTGQRRWANQRGVKQLLSQLGKWVHEHLENIRSQRTPHLRLVFADRCVDFFGLKEFEFALASRTEFPASRVHDLMALTPAELEDTAMKIRQVERDFAEILALAVRQPEFFGESFCEIQIKLFSQDHGWREIMEGLVQLGPAYDAYKSIALIKYMQYLRARQNIMRSAFIEKSKFGDNAGSPAPRHDDGAASLAISDTEIFDLQQVQDGKRRRDADSGDGHVTLAKGETVTLHLGEEREVELLLAGIRLRLYTGREFYLVDADNNTHPLHAGKNLIGRHAVCDVVLDAACRSVSRSHLILQPVSEHEIQLTDLSSHGTEVPARFLRPH